MTEKTGPSHTQAEAVLGSSESYAAVFHKPEWMKGRYNPREEAYFKFKKPFKAYMKWIGEVAKGREVLFAEGWNDNRI